MILPSCLLVENNACRHENKQTFEFLFLNIWRIGLQKPRKFRIDRNTIRPNKKKYLVSVTLSQIFRGGRACFFFKFYSFLNFLMGRSRKDPYSPHGGNFCCPKGEGGKMS